MKNCDLTTSNNSQAVRKDLLSPADEENIVSSVRELVKAYNATRQNKTEQARQAVSDWEKLDDSEIDAIITDLFTLSN